MKPRSVIQLLPETRSPSAPPVKVTLAPAAGVKVIGTFDVPRDRDRNPLANVPVTTTAVSPAKALAAAAPIVGRRRASAGRGAE